MPIVAWAHHELHDPSPTRAEPGKGTDLHLGKIPPQHAQKPNFLQSQFNREPYYFVQTENQWPQDREYHASWKRMVLKNVPLDQQRGNHWMVHLKFHTQEQAEATPCALLLAIACALPLPSHACPSLLAPQQVSLPSHCTHCKLKKISSVRETWATTGSMTKTAIPTKTFSNSDGSTPGRHVVDEKP